MANLRIGQFPTPDLPLLLTDIIPVSRDGAVVWQGNLQQLADAIGGGGSSYLFSGEETPTGAKNGVNKSFTLAHEPASGSLQLFFNGMLITITNGDYTFAGNTITLINFAPNASNDDALTAFYQY